MIRAVYFDVGETLVDETRQWGMWADWLGVPRLAFFAALGAVIERGEHHRRVFNQFVPDFDVARAMRERAAAGDRYRIEPRDFYPDALPCLSALRRQGLIVGLAGNQPAEAEEALRIAGVTADHVASSGRWGVEKPSPRFFEKIVAPSGLNAGDIAYVGDRLDNDILPAKAIGMMAIFIERGPWGVIHASRPGCDRADAHVRSLAQLPSLLSGQSLPPSNEVPED
jgi:HAD superfamily hydrolase (TIGR01549 family)